ncbi:MAG: hypothetical protein LBJ48_07125, partial [Coriobacteriales bacterium]|nr:hypothetical protein [Coriobacteriales bacterium]
MQEINWAEFAAKFAGREQQSFEWLCYLLFCAELNHDLGINRYTNHPGIETSPIDVDGSLIGFQAKYTTSPLSQITDKLVQAVNTAKANHPELNKIIFYVNRDFGLGRGGTEPRGKKRVESCARDLGIDIEWRTSSYFESPFVAINSREIAEHFFSRLPSVFDLAGELKKHTESILGSIR